MPQPHFSPRRVQLPNVNIDRHVLALLYHRHLFDGQAGSSGREIVKCC